jgi:hypothetical protein
MFGRVNEWWWDEGVGVYRNVLSVDEPHVGGFGSHVYTEITLKATPIKVPDLLPPHRPIRRMVAGCKAKREVALRKVAWEDMTGAPSASKSVKLADRLNSTSSVKVIFKQTQYE